MNAIVENHVHQAIHDAFPFEVEKFPLMGPERMETPHYGLFRTDTADCVGSAVSQRYEPHTRDDIAALCDAAIAGWNDQGMPHISCRWHHDAHVIAIRPSDDQRRRLADDSQIAARFIVRASYRTGAATGSLALFRDRCRNLLMLQDIGATTFRVIHTSGLRTRLGELAERFQALARVWDSLPARIAALDQEPISTLDFLTELMPPPQQATPRAAASYDRRIETILRRVSAEHLATGRESVERATRWTLFNAVQGWAQHDKHRRGTPDAFSRAIIALDDPIVARAQELALAM